MVKTVELYSVFISSTSEMKQERELASDIVDQINRQRGLKDGFQIRNLMWENDVTPDAGVRPQSHINLLIGDDYEIFVGMLCSKFGTATDKYGSGTEEEFSRALDRRKRHGSLPKIMFYFRDPRTAEQEIDPDELSKVMQFKKSLSEIGIYKSYSNPQEFGTYLLTNLNATIDLIREKNLTGDPELVAVKKEVEHVDLNSETDIEDVGLFDLEDIVLERFSEITRVIVGITSSQEILTSEINAATKESGDLRRLSGAATPDRRAVKRILNNISSHMDDYTKEISAAPLQLSRSFTAAVDAIQAIIIISTEDGTVSQDELEAFYKEVRSTMAILVDAKSSIKTFRDSIGALPRMMQVFNKSKRDLVNSLDSLIEFFETSVRQLESIVGGSRP